MIERWWGRRGVFAEDFAALVDRSAGGIFTGTMASTMRSRGWETLALEATPAQVKAAIADSVPVVALIRVARTRYHYVVITGWRDGLVTFHDPAVAPSAQLREADFVGRWNGAHQWAMIVRPSEPITIASAAPSVSLPAIDSRPCRPWLDRAADAAALDQLDVAGTLLDTAARECPSEAVVLREMAGVRFRQGRHADAVRLADAYAKRAPADSLGWQLLASSRYLAGDRDGALAAWNTVGRPVIDLLRIDGTSHIRFNVLASAMAAPVGEALTPSVLSFAQRRLADIPALSRSRVTYSAVGGGMVEVRAAVIELPRNEPPALVAVSEGLRGVFTSQVRLALRTPFGRGELWSAHWRWEQADPRVTLRLDMPTRVRIPVIVTLVRGWEGYRFAGTSTVERRSLSAVSLTGWITPRIEQQVGTRLERWSGRGELMAFAVGNAAHLAHDHVSLLSEAEHAVALSSAGSAYDRVRSRLVVSLAPDAWANTWSMRLGAEWASRSAPGALWSQAGGALTRDIPLRAHPLVIDDALPELQRGRASLVAGIAGDRPLTTIGQVTIGMGVFADAAHLMLRGDPASPHRLYVDGGAGLRFALAGAEWAAVRLDVARGLAADRRWAFTVGLDQPRRARLGRSR